MKFEQASAELNEWMGQEKAVTMPNELWSSLRVFLLMTTSYRKDEALSWGKLAQEKNEDGTPKYPKAEENSEFWFDMQADIEKVLRRLDA